MKVYVVRVIETVRRPDSEDYCLFQSYVVGAYSSKENAARKIIKEGDAFFKGKRDGVIDYFDHSKEIDRIASASSFIIGGQMQNGRIGRVRIMMDAVELDE